MASSVHSRSLKPPRERKARYNIKILVKNLCKLETRLLAVRLVAVFCLILVFFICIAKFVTVLSQVFSSTAIYLIEGNTAGSVAEEIGVRNEGIERKVSSWNGTAIEQEASLPKESDAPLPRGDSSRRSSQFDIELGNEAIKNKLNSGNKLVEDKEITSPAESDAHPEQEVSLRSSPKLEVKIEVPKPKSKLTCDDKSKDEGFPYARPIVCHMSGDVRVSPESSIVTLTMPSQRSDEELRIRPYARKDDDLLPKVREVIVKSATSEGEAPRCGVNYDVPAVIFSIGGYTGNFFHDMSDVLIPLYLTSYHFKGKVQYFITNYKQWWIQKYKPILRRLSHYDILDFDSNKDIHCFGHVILGLVRDRDLIIHPHPTRNPKGYSMVDFTRFLRHAYGLRRDRPIVLGEQPGKRPRMLIISRKGTRKLVNLRNVVAMSTELGFEVVISEAGGNIKRFTRIVNSCDVLLAVHGAGLTNQIFLPTRAIVIQVVPWGKMDWMATNFYGQPAQDMNLRYLEYYISEEESSLAQRYPRDHIVFRDPMAIHGEGWQALADIIMTQDVRLNLWRFRPTLLQALDLLQE